MKPEREEYLFVSFLFSSERERDGEKQNRRDRKANEIDRVPWLLII